MFPQIDRAGCWFLVSGIQDSSGGVARFHRADSGRNERVSTEITGYAVSALVYLHEITQRGEYLDAARRAGTFLLHEAWDPRLSIFPFEHGRNGDRPQPLAYFFDSGIIARGLLSLWRATREQQWLDAAHAAGVSMLRDFTSADFIHPVLQLPSRQPLPWEPRWSRSPGCYQAKSALAWHDLAALTGERRFAEAWERALDGAIATHDSFLPDATPENTMDRLHAYCYFLEALLAAADRDDVRRLLAGGIERVGGYLREIEPVFVRSDVFAQLLRVRLWAAEYGVALDAGAAAEEAAALPEFQYPSDADLPLRGGFCFGRKGGVLMPFANPVSTAFAAQAMALWIQRETCDPLPPRHTLI